MSPRKKGPGKQKTEDKHRLYLRKPMVMTSTKQDGLASHPSTNQIPGNQETVSKAKAKLQYVGMIWTYLERFSVLSPCWKEFPPAAAPDWHDSWLHGQSLPEIVQHSRVLTLKLAGTHQEVPFRHEFG